jgi:hypothetical protein
MDPLDSREQLLVAIDADHEQTIGARCADLGEHTGVPPLELGVDRFHRVPLILVVAQRRCVLLEPPPELRRGIGRRRRASRGWRALARPGEEPRRGQDQRRVRSHFAQYMRSGPEEGTGAAGHQRGDNVRALKPNRAKADCRV